MSEYFIVNDIRGRSLKSRSLNLITVPGMVGAHLQDIIDPPRTLEVDITVKGIDEKDLRSKIDEINSIIISKNPVPLSFSDEEDLTYYGITEGVEQSLELDRIHQTTLYIVCPDPYKYKPSRTLHFPSGIVSVPNNGQAETEPIFELNVKEKSTYAMVTNGRDEYNLIGTPADDDIQQVDYRTSALYENGSTVGDWQPTQERKMVAFDSNIDSLDTELGSDDAGIRIWNNGTPKDKQRGGAIFRELEEPLQDYEIVSTFDIISRREIENFRTMIYFLDENMNSIGQMGVKDNNRNYKRRVPIAQLGEHNQRERLIGDSSPYLQPAPDTTLMYFRVRREGQKITFYIAHWRNQRHDTIWEASFNDVNNEYQGKLRYITLFIETYQDRVTPNRNRINSVEVFKLSTAEEDQTPYILYPDDIVTFDHKNEDILINGEPRNDLKNFGGSFFTLKKGENIISVTPEESFETSVTFEEKHM